jgi:hypothetical protein
VNSYILCAMDAILVTLGSVITIAAIIPYLVQVVRRKTKPRIVSWFTWSLLTGIASAASFTDGQIATGLLMLAATIEVLSVVVFGFKYGDRTFDRTDIICQIAAFVGLALWLAFNSPAVAVVATVTIDLIAAIPTLKHSWLKPHEETWITFVLSALGGAPTLLVIAEWSITSATYPVYIVIVNSLMAAVILASPHRSKRGAIRTQGVIVYETEQDYRRYQ